MNQYILHVDLDAFFASVEQLDNPQYRGKPVIVGGLPHERRGVVSTCSYEARKFGVHSAMPTAKAYQLCPQGIFLHGRMWRYHELSKKVMSIFYDFSPDVRQMSVDEAFIDISGTEMLFGSPEETAKKIQDTVFAQTGLTVSIGLASNHYVAKIASGYKKPKGLCYVPHGSETDFMLSLPLSKLWGAGTKTQEKLNTFGLYTIKQIYETPLNNLVSLFGTCTGNFLYNAVRGQEVETFTEPTKSRSLSTEETFVFDLHDIFAIETALLRLCYDVQFRMLDEGFISRTLHIKIRYEDFTTVSCQATYQRYISSVDDLFEKAKLLFTKKNTQNKGIRLLGVGLSNLERGTSPAQTELFDFGDEKKQKLEKAVLEIHKKDPKSKVIKARQFIKTLLLILCFTFARNYPVFGEIIENKDITQNQDFRENTYIVQNYENRDFRDSIQNEELSTSNENSLLKQEITGFYEANIKSNIELLNTDGVFELAFKPLVFSQKIGLSVWLEYADTWSFEANTEDGFSNNTLLLSYINKSKDSFLKEFKIGNKDIFFPLNYGINQQNKGFASGSNLSFGAMLSFQQEFKNDQKFNIDFATKIDLAKTESKTWVGKNEQSQIQINYADFQKNKKFYLLPNVNFLELYYFSDGKWKQFSKNDFLILQSRNELEVFSSDITKIAATVSNKAECKTELDLFIDSAKTYFTKNLNESDFYKFLGASSEQQFNSEQFFTQIDGKAALLLLNEPVFSLFSYCNTYNLEKNATVVNLNSDYSIYVDEKNEHFSVKNNANTSKVAELFPFASDFPYLYLLPNSKNDTNSTLCFTTVSKTNSDSYKIGSDVITSSITVYKNGSSIPFNYNQKTSSVELLSPVSDFDTITITWNTNGKNATTPFFSTAFGLSYDWSSLFNTNLSAYATLPVTFDSPYATSKTPKSLKASVALSANYKKNTTKSDFAFSDVLETSLDVPNYSEKYLFLELQNNATSSLYFDETKIKTDTNLLNVNASAIQTRQGDYELCVEAENAKTQGDYFVATFDAPKKLVLLQNATTFSFLFKNQTKTNILDNYKVFLQIGDFSSINSADFRHPENDNSNATIEITTQIHNNTNDFNKITISLDKLQKSRLGNCSKIRLTFIKNTDETENSSIKIALKGMEEAIFGSEFEISQFLTATDTTYTKNFGKIPFDSTILNKNITQFTFLKPNNAVTTRTETATKTISPFSLSYYKNLTFKVFIPENFYSTFANTKIELALLQTTSESEKEILTHTIEAKKLKSGKWNIISIPVNSKETVNKVKFAFFDESYTPTTATNFELLPTIYFSDFFTSGSFVDFGVSNTAEATFSAKDFLVFNELNTHAKVNTKSNFSNQFFLNNDFSTDFGFKTKLLDLHTFFDFSLNQNETLLNPVFSANLFESDVSTSNMFLPFRFLTLKDTLFVEKDSIKKGNAVNFSLEPAKINLNFNNSIQSGKNNTDFTRQINHNFSFSGKIIGFSLATTGIEQAKTNQSNFFNKFYSPYDLYFVQTSNNLTLRSYEVASTQNIKFKKVNPQLSILLKSQISPKTTNQNESKVSYNLEIPFAIMQINFSASYSDQLIAKSPLGQTKDNWYFGDFEQFRHIYELLPSFYLLNDNLQNRIKQNSFFDYAEKENTFKFSMNKSIFATNWDILVPTSLSVSYGTNKKATENSLNKLNTFEFSAMNTAFNIFGKNAAKPVFAFFEQDEFINILNISYSAQKLKFKNESEYNIYFTIFDRLKNSLIFEYSTEFSVYLQSFWYRPGESSLLSLLVQLFPNSLKTLLQIDETQAKNDEQNLQTETSIKTEKISRKDGISIAFSSKKQQIGFEHSVNYKPSEHFELFTELSAMLTLQKQSFATNFGFSLGGKVSF